MRSLLSLFLIGLARSEEESAVLVLTNDNFDAAVAEHKFLLVEFYAPWCGHCKALEPEYEMAAQQIGSRDPASEIKLAKVDATEEPDLAKRFDVGGYPTLKFFKNHATEGLEYGGGRTKDEIISWLDKKSGPPAHAINGADAANKFKDDNDVVVVAYQDDATVFVAVADSIDDYQFGLLDADAAAALNVENGQIVLFKDFDDNRVDFDGELTHDELSKFIKSEALPLVNEFNEETAPKIFGGDITQHLLLFVAKSDANYDSIRSEFAGAAKGHKGSTLFVLVDADVDDNGRVLEFFGLEAENCPAVRLIQMGDSMAKFKPEDDALTTASFNAFVKGVESGKIGKHLMSEEEPEDNTGPVYYVTGKNFASLMAQTDKHILIEFYAPWCGHCKALEPTYEKLGEHFKDQDDVIIAKTDATANEFEDVDVQGFPTIKFWAKGDDREGVDYNGGRDLEALIKFVESGGTEGNEAGEEDDDYEDDEDYDDEDYEDEDEDEDYDDEEGGHDEL